MAEALIFRQGAVGFHTVVGKSDLEKGTPLEANQVYQLMSNDQADHFGGLYDAV